MNFHFTILRKYYKIMNTRQSSNDNVEQNMFNEYALDYKEIDRLQKLINEKENAITSLNNKISTKDKILSKSQHKSYELEQSVQVKPEIEKWKFENEIKKLESEITKMKSEIEFLKNKKYSWVPENYNVVIACDFKIIYTKKIIDYDYNHFVNFIKNPQKQFDDHRKHLKEIYHFKQTVKNNFKLAEDALKCLIIDLTNPNQSNEDLLALRDNLIKEKEKYYICHGLGKEELDKLDRTISHMSDAYDDANHMIDCIKYILEKEFKTRRDKMINKLKTISCDHCKGEGCFSHCVRSWCGNDDYDYMTYEKCKKCIGIKEIIIYKIEDCTKCNGSGTIPYKKKECFVCKYAIGEYNKCEACSYPNNKYLQTCDQCLNGKIYY